MKSQRHVLPARLTIWISPDGFLSRSNIVEPGGKSGALCYLNAVFASRHEIHLLLLCLTCELLSGQTCVFFCCLLLFSLSANPLYPNCAVLSVSRHTGKVMLLSCRKRAKYSVLFGITLPCIKCYHWCLLRSLFQRVEVCVHSPSLLALILERTFQCRDWLSCGSRRWCAGREGCRAHTSRD